MQSEANAKLTKMQKSTDVDTLNKAKELERQIQEYDGLVKKYSQELQKYQIGVNSEIQEWQGNLNADITEFTTKRNNEISKYTAEMQGRIQEYSATTGSLMQNFNNSIHKDELKYKKILDMYGLLSRQYEQGFVPYNIKAGNEDGNTR